MDEDLADVLGTEESPGLEFKQSVKDTGALLSTICAFANDLPKLSGGDLLIGVDDRGKPVDGVDTSDKALLTLTEMRDSGKIIDRPSMVVTRAVFAGRTVIRIRVEASNTPPVRLNGTAWVRPGPTTRRASRDDERVLTEKRRAKDKPFDARPLQDSSLEDIDLALFTNDILPAFVAPEVLEENGRPLAQQLASLGVTDSEEVPTGMGLLLAGLNPTAFIPGAYLQFIRYEGTTVDGPISDSQEIRGNLVDSVERLQSVLRGHLHTRVESTDGFREHDVPDYPLNALREACMNAIIHRNYETSYAPTKIAWFSDRIEITNPGGPFGQVRVDNFDRVTDYRNPSLAGAMKALGFVNRFGRGIGRIQAALRDNDNPAAEFVVDDSSWLVTIRKPA
ncbi:ATP-binding protein [Actinokineospora sp. NBRC 105648]|uniref:ATP-binding protein n=1 Tax=Actinokineospora sp. NBRC 105648 TaxID=3032206 RepID=UPI0024A0B6C1|nr:ATP-binding protein [Actinokineospora sp. NBRC 105648]GLZ38517.1 ArsR family transcriptional regulator [Actinokineospora sp. NBRC 105648]